jgi:hypothetical protein
MAPSLPLLLLCATLGVTGLAGCSNEPELNTHVTPDLRNADYPKLVPIEGLLPPLPAPETQSTELEQNLKARSSNLERRAEALRRAQN